jgi:hypothetical protein
MADHAQAPAGDTGPPLNAVEVEMPDGIWILIYGPGPDFPVLGTSFVPAALMDDES